MRLTASQLRSNIYKILDQVLETGVAVEVERNGRLLLIAPVAPSSKLDRLIQRPCLVGDPEEIVHLDWSAEWKP